MATRYDLINDKRSGYLDTKNGICSIITFFFSSSMKKCLVSGLLTKIMAYVDVEVK